MQKTLGESIGIFPFTDAVHQRFAELSGDWNPLHMDQAAARRSQFGRPVVHGLHTILRALDMFAAERPSLPAPSKMTARFPAPAYVGDTVRICLAEHSNRHLRVQVRADNTVVADVRVSLGDVKEFSRVSQWGTVDGENTCRQLSLPEIAGRSGAISLASTPEPLRAEFPHAAKWLGIEIVGSLMCLTRLIGMECPGLYSLFSGFAVEFRQPCSALSLQYRVGKVSEQFRIIKIDVEGLGLHGAVEAFLRYPPVLQKSMKEVAAFVAHQEFKGQKTLIIGGSRGLGELTAKIIASGGGHPIITYAVGENDAKRVAQEINQWGGKCDLRRYDIRIPAHHQVSAIDVSSLYYFATPPILGRTTEAEFRQFYVTAFHDLCVALHESSKNDLSIFYPSSIFVRDRPPNMMEYAEAKAAGEALCAELGRSHPSLRIMSLRLPRILTDQTATIAPLENADAIETMLPVVRKMQAMLS